MSANTGGAAFPQIETYEAWAGNRESGFQAYGDVRASGGMTLRDYFAASASEGDITQHTPIYSRDGAYVVGNRTREQAKYAHADAMLAARSTEAK